MKKRYMALALLAALSATAFAGCANNKKDKTPSAVETAQTVAQSKNSETSTEKLSEEKNQPKDVETKTISNEKVESKTEENSKKEKKNNKKQNAENKAQDKKASNAEIKKLSGKFVCVDSPILKLVE